MAGWPHPKNYSQQFGVKVKTSNECLLKVRSVLGSRRLIIFMNGTDSRTELTLRKFAYFTMLSGADLLEGMDAIQRELEKLKGCSQVQGFEP